MLALAWLGWDRGYSHSGGRPIEWRDVTATTSGARFPRPTVRVIERREELIEVLPRGPAIDFGEERAVLVASGPRSSSGYALDVLSVRAERRRVVVTVRERSPSLSAAGRPGVTYPFRLITLPRSDKRVEVERGS